MTESLKHSELKPLRELLSKLQHGQCPICGRILRSPCVDHSHRKRLRGSGLVRGVLCRTCNSFLAKSENNAVRYRIPLKDLPQVLRNMADYLERPPTRYLHPSERPKPRKLSRRSYHQLIRQWHAGGFRSILPPYPRSGHMTKRLLRKYNTIGLEPVYIGREG